MNRVICRSLFYSKDRISKKNYSDNRDAYYYMKQFETHEDIRAFVKFYITNFKFRLLTWGTIVISSYYYLKETWRRKELFEANYLNQQPVREYESEDYDYKFWEMVRTRKGPKGETSVNSDAAVKEKYLVVYLAKTSDSGLSMQRFSRLQKYVTMRKNIPLDSVFICLDEEVDIEVLDEYVSQHSPDTIATYPQNSQVLKSLPSIFLNLGCIYLIERQTGNVLSIVDPQKHPLEAIGKKFIFIISKNMDFRLSQEVIKKEINFKSNKEDELSSKRPLY